MNMRETPAWTRAFEHIVAAADEAILVTDAELDTPGPRILYANAAFEALTGYTHDEILGATPRILQGEETDRAVLDRLRRCLEADREFEGTVINYRKDGTPLVMRWQIRPYHDDSGSTLGYVSLQRLVDVGSREGEPAGDVMQREIFGKQSIPMLLLNPLTGSIVDANPTAAAFYGYTRPMMARMSIDQIATLTPEELRAELARPRHNDSTMLVDRHRLATGDMRKVEVNWSPVTLAGREYVHAIVHDISDNERLAAEARQRLYSDPATGLPNQVAFRESLAAYYKSSLMGDQMVIAALVRATDLEDIADVTGIEGADQLIGAIGRHIRSLCTNVTGVYRVGTPEIGVIVETGDKAELERTADELHEAAGASFELKGVPIRIQPAIGLTHSGDHYLKGPGDIIWHARLALRQAILMERDWASYEPRLEPQDSGSIELIALAERALEANEFELHYQPKMRLSDATAVGAEALARWRQPGEGIIPPGKFMPKLENTSLIDMFSRFVIANAGMYVRSEMAVPISVNLAPRNLADRSLIDTLVRAPQEYGFPPELFEVEVTESAFMFDPEETIKGLYLVRDAGIGVSIDDFGTGYASLSYLHRLPVTNVKMDRAFVRPLEKDSRTRRLLQAMVEAAHALGLTVTAEGVETEGQAAIVTELGCDFAQGFLWSPALPVAEFRGWLAERG